MPEFLGEDAKRIVEEEGLSVEDYSETIHELEQARLNMGVFRNIAMMANNRPTEVKQVKAIEIQKRIELEKKKAEDQTAVMKTYIRWMMIYDKVAASRRYMEVEVDEGANANFLTHGMAADRRLQVQSLGSKPFRGETINGDVVCCEYVKVALFSGNHDEHRQIEAEFYILPAHDPPNDPRIDKPIVGRHLLQEAGHLLLTEDPRDPVRTTKMGKESPYMKEQRKQQAASVEAYQAKASQKRDATRSNQHGKSQNQHNRGNSTSGTHNQSGK